MAGKLCVGATANSAYQLNAGQAFCEGLNYRLSDTAANAPKANNPHYETLTVLGLILTTYDSSGNLIATYDASGNTVVARATGDNELTTYDVSGNEITTYNIGGDALTTYDSTGTTTTVTNESSTAWDLGWDVADDAKPTELVTNGTFAADTNWTKGTGWTIAAGVATSDGTQVGDSLLTTLTVPTTVAAASYTVSFEVTAYTAGNVALQFDGTEIIADKAAPGTYSAVAVASDTTGTIDIVADLDFVGSVDNVSILKVNTVAVTDAPCCAVPQTTVLV